MPITYKALIALVAFALTQAALCCTTVFWNNNGIANTVARSVDLYENDHPRIIIYPRGIARSGETGEHSLKWQSKYGNIVISEFNSSAVSDGMNEHGLVVHLLYLSKTEYPKYDQKKPAISNVLWAQYMLDNYKTVNEALAGTKDLQIVATSVNGKEWPLHLTMEDPSGDSAIIEFLNGKMKVYHGPQYQVMTNEPAYNIQLANLKRYRAFGGTLPLPGDPDPLSRFVRVAAYLKTLPPPKTDLDAIAGVLAVIRTAAVPFGAVDYSGNEVEDAWATRWISVADLKNKIYYFNSTSAPNIIWVDLKELDFNEGAAVLAIDPTDVSLVGNVAKKLKPLTQKRPNLDISSQPNTLGEN